MRTSKADIEKALARIKLNHGVELSCDWISGRPRIEPVDCSRFLSWRGTKREISMWLDGFEAALEHAEATALTLARIGKADVKRCVERNATT